MAVLITKQEQHSCYTNNEIQLMPGSLRDAPTRKRKLIVDIEDEEEYDENIVSLATEPGDFLNQGVSVIKEVPKAKRSRTISKRMRPRRVEDAKSWSSSLDKFVSSKKTWQPLSFGGLKYDSLEEEGEGCYRSLRKLSKKEGTVKHRMTVVEKKGFLDKRHPGNVCKTLDEKKNCGNKLKKKKGESESEEEWTEHKEKHRVMVNLSSNQEKENVNHQRTLKRRCVSSNRFSNKNFFFCDWVDDEEDLASIIDTGIGGNDSMDTSRIQNSDDPTKTERSLCGKRKCGDSAKCYLSNLSSSPSSSSSSSSSLSISKHDLKAVKRSRVQNLKVNGKKSIWCHQCGKADRRIVVPCTKCEENFYCIQCIKKWYPSLIEEDVAEACLYCRKNCNCNKCLHSPSTLKTSKRDINNHEKIQHLQYLIAEIYPYLEQIHQEQIKVIEVESTIQAAVVQKKTYKQHM